MFCKYCGNELPEGANFCSRCGKIIEEIPQEETPKKTETEDLFAAPVGEPVGRSAGSSEGDFDDGMFAYAEAGDPCEAEKDALGGSILKFGIMSLAFAWSGILALLGLIFACIAKSKIKVYVAKFSETEGRATVGKILSTIGLILSIVFMGIFVFAFLMGLLAGLMEATAAVIL